MKKAYIIGAGSVGLHVAENAAMYGLEGRIMGFFDDNPNLENQILAGYPLLGTCQQAVQLSDVDLVLGIAFPKVKQKVAALFQHRKDLYFPTLIASGHTWISKDCNVGEGCIIYPGTSVNYGSRIQKFVVINMNCALGHHAQVGNFSSLAPGVNLGGHTSIGSGVEMGIGASTLQQVKIGDDAVIGGMTMVINDVPSGATCLGVPGRLKK